MKNLTIIWGGTQFPMMSSGLDDAQAQELADDLRARGLSFSVLEEEVA